MKAVEIFDKGTWNGAKFVADDLEEIVSNTNTLIGTGKIKKPSIKLGHSTNQILKGQEDGDPSLGSLSNIRLSDAGKIVADFDDVPEILVKAIEKGLYKQISSELTFFKAFGWVVTAVAVLGADIPAVKTLDDLNNFMSDDPSIIPVKQDGQTPLFFSISPEFINKDDELEQQEELKMSEELKKQLAEMQAEKQKLEEEKKVLLAEKIEAKFSEKKAEVLSLFTQDVKDGKLQPALFDKIEKHLEEQKKNFAEQTEELNFSVELVREVAKSFSATLPQAEVAEEVQEETENFSDPIEALEDAIQKVQKETNKSYTEASDFVFESNPQLFKEYNAFVSEIHGK